MNGALLEFGAVAQKWREENPGRGGVIVIFNGKWDGWMNTLRNPDHWRPGCIAVAEDGGAWIATGGDDHAGAKEWRSYFPINL